MMTDKEKVAWFDKTIEWIDQFGSADGARAFADDSPDAPRDVFYDFVNQYEKVMKDD